MSTPQWFADFERSETLRAERLDQIAEDVARWRAYCAIVRALRWRAQRELAVAAARAL